MSWNFPSAFYKSFVSFLNAKSEMVIWRERYGDRALFELKLNRKSFEI